MDEFINEVSSELGSTSSISDNDLAEILSANGFPAPDADIANGHPEYNIEDAVNQDFEIQIETPRTDSEAANAISQNIVSAMEALDEAIDGVERANAHAEDEEPINIPNEDIPEPEESDEDAIASIPENSPTLSIDETTSRFSGAAWYNEMRNKRIILAGLGGIGSFTAFMLARLRPSQLYLYDGDTVESGNMSGQMYGPSDVGSTKASAIGSIIRMFNGYGYIVSREMYTERSEKADIMICGFDNMDARRLFFHAWVNHVFNAEDRSKCIFIDGRLSIDTLQVFCITGDDDYNMRRYTDEFLFSDEEADATVCSLKQTTYMAAMIGSFITNLFVNFVANQTNPPIPYSLPFFTEYDATNMIFKAEN